MDKTAELLRKLQRDKEIYGVHPCCFTLSTGPHAMECPVEHPGPYYSPEIPFVPADPDVCTCVDPWSNCPTHG